MVDFRLPDDAQHRPELRAAGLSAAGLYAMAGAEAMAQLTDGWVPDYFVTGWGPAGRRAASTLVRAGLWRRETRGGIAGYAFTDWSAQRTAEQVRTERDRARARMADVRARGSRPRSPERSPERSSEHTPNVRAKFAERSANVRDSLSRSRRGSLSGGVPEGNARARSTGHPPDLDGVDPANPRCALHRSLPVDDPGPPCGRCAAVRERVEAHERRAAAERAAVVSRCRTCDGEGWLLDEHRIPVTPPVRCDHTRAPQAQIGDHQP